MCISYTDPRVSTGPGPFQPWPFYDCLWPPRRMSRRFLFPRGGSTLQNAKVCVCLTFKPFNCANQYRVEGERAVLESVLCMWPQTSEIHTSACCQARGSLSRSTYFLPGGPGPGTGTLRTWPVSFCSFRVRGQCQPHGPPVIVLSHTVSTL